MNYQEFSQEVTEAVAAKKALDAFAQVQTDGTHICPRCGRLTMKERLSTNALSRYGDIYICDSCGMDEAIRAFTGTPLFLKDWAIFKVERPDSERLAEEFPGE